MLTVAFATSTGVFFQAWFPLGHVLLLPLFNDSRPNSGRVALKQWKQEKFEIRRLLSSDFWTKTWLLADSKTRIDILVEE